MSFASKITLGGAGAFTVGIILYVNGKQMIDKLRMNEGVLHDIQRKEKKKIENIYWLEQQMEVKKMLQKEQYEDDKIALKLLENSENEC